MRLDKLVTWSCQICFAVVPEIAEVRLAKPRAIAEIENFILNLVEDELILSRG
jgi:hypothetical protein